MLYSVSKMNFRKYLESRFVWIMLFILLVIIFFHYFSVDFEKMYFYSTYQRFAILLLLE